MWSREEMNTRFFLLALYKKKKQLTKNNKQTQNKIN